MANIRLGANRNVYAARFGCLLSGVTVLGDTDTGPVSDSALADRASALAAKRAKLAARQLGVPAPYVAISKINAAPDWNTLMSYWLSAAQQAELSKVKWPSWNWGNSSTSVQTVRKVQFPATFPTQLDKYAGLVYPHYLYLPSAPAMSLAAHMIKAWGDFLYDGAGNIPEYESAIDKFQRGAEEIKKNFFRDFAGISYGPAVGDIYVTPMLTLLRFMAAELVAQAKALQESEDQTARNAISYYEQGMGELIAVQQTVTAADWLFKWEMVLKNRSDEAANWELWQPQTSHSSLREQLGEARRKFRAEWERLAVMVQQKIAARAKEESLKTGTEVSYGDIARTNVLRTGTWSRVELDVQSTSAAQIAGAVARMDGYIIQLKPALKAEISKAKALYNQITPMAQAYAEGTSLAVSTDPKFIAKVEEFNNIVLQLEARFGGAPAGGVKWGLILGLGAAAVGAFMLAT